MKKHAVILLLLLSSFAHAQLNLDWFSGTCPAHTGSYPFDIKVDVQGYSYACGYDANHNACIRKVDPSGNEVWLAVFDSVPGSEEFHSIILDNAGYLYVTGIIPQGFYQDVLTCKYDTAGNRIWCRTYNGPDMKEDQGWKIMSAPNGDIIVGGNSYYNSNNVDALAISYSVNGNQNWATAHNVWYSTGDYNRGLSIDANGNIYLAQWSGSVCSLGANGAFRWATNCTPGNTVQNFCGDKNGNTYAVGVSGSSCIINKFDQFGNQNWDTVFAPHSTDMFLAACFDSSLNLYAAGRMNTHYVVVSLDSLKNPRWSYSGQPINSQVVQITARKNIVAYCGDWSNVSNSGSLTGAIDTSGIFIGDHDFLNAGASWARNYSVAIDTNMTLRIAGQETYSNPSPCTELIALKYHISSLTNNSVLQIEHSFEIYPDPAENEITLSIPSGDGMTTFIISDVSGRRVFYAECSTPESHFHFDLCSGIYFATIIPQNDPAKKQTKKIIIR